MSKHGGKLYQPTRNPLTKTKVLGRVESNNNVVPLQCNVLKSESKGLLCSVTSPHNLLSEKY